MDALLRRRAMIASGGGSPTPPTPPTPTGLVYYDRLIFDGTAYIDTTITPADGSSFRVKLGNESLKAQQRAFQLPAENSTAIGMLYNSNTSTTQRQLSAYYGASGAVFSNFRVLYTANPYLFFLTSKCFGYGTTIKSFTRGENAPSGPLVLGSNPSRSGQAYSGTMWTFRIYGSETEDVVTDSGFDNYTPVYTLRPCTYNGEAGMWCVETDTFYGNTAGVGTLTVAND